MKTRIRNAPRGRRGIALLYALFGAFAAASMVSVMLTMGTVTSDRASLKRDTTQAMYLAEGGIEHARKEIQTSIANWMVPPETGTVEIAGTEVDYSISPTGAAAVREDGAGIQSIVAGYEVRASAFVNGVQGTANRIINAESTPIFQFAVFYQDDLEIHPGPDMLLSGRVHSNSDMFLASNGTLTMDTNYVRCVGEIYRRRKNASDSPGTVDIRRWVENPLNAASPVEFARMDSQGQLASQGVTSASGFDSDFLGFDANGDGDLLDADDWLPFASGSLELWSEPDGYGLSGHTVLTGEHGMREAVTPGIGSIQMYEESSSGDWVWNPAKGEFVLAATPGGGTHDKGYFHENAGLSILVSRSGDSWKATDAEGHDWTSELEGTGAVKIETLVDTRQSGGSNSSTRIAIIDLGILGGLDAWPDNGLLYAGHFGTGQGTQAKGIQLTNGSALASPLTTVSEGAVYVHGDFNTVDQKGAAVIADAVNLLSNAWDGSKRAGQLPSAAATTFNVAMITGNHETAGANYNGGLENLPRFHERWSGVPCNITGSFVNTWESEKATGLWVYGGDRYTAPLRNWAYDQRFNRVANLPPFTPMVVSATDVVSW